MRCLLRFSEKSAKFMPKILKPSNLNISWSLKYKYLQLTNRMCVIKLYNNVTESSQKRLQCRKSSIIQEGGGKTEGEGKKEENYIVSERLSVSSTLKVLSQYSWPPSRQSSVHLYSAKFANFIFFIVNYHQVLCFDFIQAVVSLK